LFLVSNLMRLWVQACLVSL